MCRTDRTGCTLRYSVSMDGNSCPRELNFPVGFKMISKIVRLQHRDHAGHDKVELDKDFRT